MTTSAFKISLHYYKKERFYACRGIKVEIRKRKIKMLQRLTVVQDNEAQQGENVKSLWNNVTKHMNNSLQVESLKLNFHELKISLNLISLFSCLFSSQWKRESFNGSNELLTKSAWKWLLCSKIVTEMRMKNVKDAKRMQIESWFHSINDSFQPNIAFQFIQIAK